MTRRSDTVLLFTGSFDPFTIGHKDIVERGLLIADRVVIAIGVNESKGQRGDRAARRACIERVFAGRPEVEVTEFSGLAVDEARRVGATALLRGVRGMADFEYERNMADINRRISGLETVLLIAVPELACVSSSMVRELDHFGHDVSGFLP